MARIGTAEALRSSRLRLRAAARLEESGGARTLGSLAWVVPALRIESGKEHGLPSPAQVPVRGVARVSLLTDPARQMRLTIETEREDDGRWIAEVIELPGVMAYGESREDATRRAKALALRVVAERLEQGEPSPRPNTIQFAAA